MSGERITEVEPTTRPRILVGVDGSDDALRAVRYGAGTSLRLGTDLWLVHAVDDGVLTGGWGVVYDPTILSQVGEEALDDARAYAVELGMPDDRIHTEVLMGHPMAVLADLSEAAELCVVGRRATSGIERMFVGSTSVALAGSVQCPLIVISAVSTPDPTDRHGRIAVALTAPERSKHQLLWALQEARSRNSTLVVAHVVPPPPTGLLRAFRSRGGERDTVAVARRDLDALIAEVRLQDPDVRIEGEVLYGIPVEELIAQTAGIDLLVLGLHSHPVTGLAFSGPLRGVLAHSSCPVCLVS